MLLSVHETCEVLNRLEAKALSRLGPDGGRLEITPRKLRYLDTCAVLEAARADNNPTQARLYDAVRVAMLRLFIQLQAEGVGDARARAALVYLADDLRHEFERPSSRRVLFMAGARGQIVPVSGLREWQKTFPDALCVPLADAMKGTREAIAAIRKREGRMWTGRKFEAASTLAVTVINA